MKLTFASYNICHCSGMDGKVDLGRTAKVIRSFGADCVGLQEVDRFVERSGNIDELAEIAKLTGMYGFFGKAIDLGKGEYGVAILSRRPANIICHKPLPGNEMRTLLGISTTTEDGLPYAFYCTHFALNTEHRLLSSGIVSEEMVSREIPSAIVGDFNCQPDSMEWKVLACRMKSAHTGLPLPTHPSPAPRIAIDHCFLTPSEVWSNTCVEDVAECVASDHRPIIITTEIR